MNFKINTVQTFMVTIANYYYYITNNSIYEQLKKLFRTKNNEIVICDNL